MQRRFVILLILCFIGFIALGLPDAVIGVAWPAIRADFDLPIEALGPLLIAATAGSVIASSFSGPVLARMGIGRLLAFSCLLTAVALSGYAVAPSWPVMVALGLLAGFGAGAIDAAINTHAAVQYSARAVNVLHASYAIGAAGGPALMTATLASGQRWQDGYLIIVAVEVALAALFIATRSLWPAPAAHHESHRPAHLIETLRMRAVQLSMIIFVLYTGCEAGAGAWIFSLLYESRGIETAAAGSAVTLYWVGLFASRLGYAFLPGDARPGVVIGASIATAVIATAVLAARVHPTIDYIAIAVMGFAAGPIFPSMIATTPQRIGARHTANAVGMQVSMGAIGIALLPALCGVSAEQFGLESIPLLLTACWMVLFGTYALLGRVAARSASAV